MRIEQKRAEIAEREKTQQSSLGVLCDLLFRTNALAPK